MTLDARGWLSIVAVWLAACAGSASIVVATNGGGGDLPPWMSGVMLAIVFAAMSLPLAVGCGLGGVSVPRLSAMVTGIVVQIVLLARVLDFPSTLLAGFVGAGLIATMWRRREQDASRSGTDADAPAATTRVEQDRAT